MIDKKSNKARGLVFLIQYVNIQHIFLTINHKLGVHNGIFKAK